MTLPPSQVPLHNRYEALQVVPNNDEDDGSPSLEESPRLSQPTPCIKTTRSTSSVLQGMMEETTRPSRSIPGSVTGVRQNFGFFSSWACLHDTGPAGDRRGTPASKGEKDLCIGVRAHQASFKLDL